MASPNPTENPHPESGRSVPDRPTPTVAELTAAVQQAAETVARVTGGGDADADRSAGASLQTTAPLQTEALRKTLRPDDNGSSPDAGGRALDSSVAGDLRVVDTESDAATIPTKKKSVLAPRWSYVITRGIVVVLVWAFFSFVFDPLIQSVAVQSAQTIVSAKVDVQHFSTEFFPPRVRIENVAVASRKKPGTNLIEFATLEGDVDGLALMKKSFIFNRAAVTGLQWGTARKDTGTLEEAEDRGEETSDESEVAGRLKAAGREWASGLLERASMKYDPRNLETYVLADQFEDEWKRDFDDLEQRVGDVENQAKQLKKLFETAKRDPLRNLSQVDQIVTGGLQLKEKLKQIQADVGNLPPRARQDLKTLNEARQRDTDRIQRDIKDLVLNEDKLSEFLLGPQSYQRVTQALEWLKWTDDRVERMGSTGSDRTRGEDIPFTDTSLLPDFLARLVSISGEGEIAGDHLVIQGTVSDVTSDPVLHGRPTIVRLTAQGGADVTLHATIDRTRDVPSNEMNLSYERSQTSQETLGDHGTFAVIVHSRLTQWTVNLTTQDEALGGTIVLRQKPVRLQAQVKDGCDERLRKIIESAVSAVDEVQATVTLSGTVRQPQWKLRTTLGRQISRGVQRGMNNAVRTQKAALVAKIDGELQERQQAFLGLLNGRYGDIAQQLKVNEGLLQELNADNLIQRVGGGRFDPRRFLK